MSFLRLSRASQALALFFVVIAFIFTSAAPALAGRATSIVIDAESGEILHASAADARAYPASLTKMMTLYMVFDALEKGKLRLDQELPVSVRASKQAPSKLGLPPGQTISVEDAVLALVTKSANDIAVVAAEAVGGSEEAFSEMMTRKARDLGMSRTTYRNASGLPNPGQMSTARDQATLARALIRNHAHYYHYFSTRQFSFRGQQISTHNRLMLRYPGADGIKTGFISASGFNLVASAKRDGRRLIGVVFGGTTAGSRDRRMADLLDEGFGRSRGSGETIETASIKDEDSEPSADAPVILKAPVGKTAAAKVQMTKAQARAAARAEAKAKAAAVKEAKAKAKTEANTAKVALAGVKAPKLDAHAELQAELDAEKAARAKPAVKLAAAPAGKAAAASWGIQVGAFSKMDAARNHAADIAKKLRLEGKVSVATGKNGSKTVYRARMLGITQDQARDACKQLAKDKASCHIISPSA